MRLRPGSGLIVLALALLGCSEQDMMPYQGRVATTALECQAAYEGAKQRQSSTPTYTPGVSLGASIIGNAIGKGMVSGMTESQYKTCLARVANIAPGTVAASPPLAVAPNAVAPAKPVVTPAPTAPAPTAPAPTGHRACRNTFSGGDGYACRPI